MKDKPAPVGARPSAADQSPADAPITGEIGPVGVQPVTPPVYIIGLPIETVGAGKEFATVAAAVDAAPSGAVILVNAGSYYNDFATIARDVTLIGVGGMVNMIATLPPSNLKGILTVDASATIENFAFSGAAISAADGGNAAGVRYEGGDLVLRNDSFSNNQDGLLAFPTLGLPSNTIVLDHDTFDHNGSGDGHTHNVYVGNVDSLTVANSLFEHAVVGHELKSRALVNTIINNSFYDGPTGTASYDIDLPYGGRDVVTNNTIEKGPDAQNTPMVHFGGEGMAYVGSSLLLQANTFIDDKGNAIGLLNETAIGADVTGNTFVNLTAARVASGLAIQTSNYDGAGNPLPNIAPPAAESGAFGMQPVTAPVYAPGSPVETVGVGKQFATIAQAVGAAPAGAVILVDAGTYTNDFATLARNVTLIGVGGVVNMVATVPPSNLKGILTVDASATIENFTFSGAAIGSAQGGDAAGVRYEGGDLVLSNDGFFKNQDGLLAFPVLGLASNTVVLSHDTFDLNGAGDGMTHNAYVGPVASLTVTGSLFEQAVAGNELKSRALANTVSGNFFYEGPTGTASYAVDLPNGGQDVVANNTIEKGPAVQNDSAVHFGGEGTPYAASSLLVQGNTFIDDKGAAVGVLNATAITVDVASNVLYNFTAARIAQGPATETGNVDGAGDPFPNQNPPCFAKGTRIASARGETAVEDLLVGDMVRVSEDGAQALRPVIWIGQCELRVGAGADASMVAPILIRAHAFGDGAPSRGLRVSPDHAVFVDGVLVPARLLVNGCSITQDSSMASVRYFHVELDRHSVIFAEGLPVESYLAGANRDMLTQGEPAVALLPRWLRDEAVHARSSCAPLATEADRVLPIWSRLADRGAAMGARPRGAAPAVWLEADGRRLSAVVCDDRVLFALPRDVTEVRIASRSARPSDARPWLDDRRRLGVCVAGIVVQTASGPLKLAIDAATLTRGWWDVEQGQHGPCRWTDGEAVLPVPRDALAVEFRLLGEMPCPAELAVAV